MAIDNLSRLLHTMAVVQRRSPVTPARRYYRKKLHEGKSPTAALRSLKRRLATVVYYRLADDYKVLTANGGRVAAA